jgi:N-acetylmuramoyl-L-alanine amidase
MSLANVSGESKRCHARSQRCSWLLIGAGFFGALTAAGAALAVPAEITRISLVAHENQVKVSIDLTAPTSAHFFSLEDPKRAVIDLTKVHAAKSLTVKPVGLVQQVRLGVRPEAGLRIVLDVAERVDLNPISSAGAHIEIDLAPSQSHTAVSVLSGASPASMARAAAPVSRLAPTDTPAVLLGPSEPAAAANGQHPPTQAVGQPPNGVKPVAVTPTELSARDTNPPAASGVPQAVATRAVIDELRVREQAGQTIVEIGFRGDVKPSVSTQDRRLTVDMSPAELGQFNAPRAVGQINGFDVHPLNGSGVRLGFQLTSPVAFHSSYMDDGGGDRHRLLIVLDAQTRAEVPSSDSAGLDISRHHNRPFVVMVDAGHGGVDPGASGHHGTHEKDVTLAIAKQLATRLNQQVGLKAVLTRDSDVFLPLRERIGLARMAQADLFISIHADAVQNSSVSGASVYVLSEHGATSEAAKWLADQQNAADLVGGVSLKNNDKVLASVLLDLSQSAAMTLSMAAAEKVITQLNTVGDVRKSQVQQAGFVVLKSPDIPSLLIESAYITNPDEEERLKDPLYQAKLADAVVAGVKQYFRENATPGARTAKL